MPFSIWSSLFSVIVILEVRSLRLWLEELKEFRRRIIEMSSRPPEQEMYIELVGGYTYMIILGPLCSLCTRPAKPRDLDPKNSMYVRLWSALMLYLACNVCGGQYKEAAPRIALKDHFLNILYSIEELSPTHILSDFADWI